MKNYIKSFNEFLNESTAWQEKAKDKFPPSVKDRWVVSIVGHPGVDASSWMVFAKDRDDALARFKAVAKEYKLMGKASWIEGVDSVKDLIAQNSSWKKPLMDADDLDLLDIGIYTGQTL